MYVGRPLTHLFFVSPSTKGFQKFNPIKLKNKMLKHPSLSSLKQSSISAISLLVFSFLDLLDFLLCFLYRFLDRIFDETPSHCYCFCNSKKNEEETKFISNTLHERNNIFRRICKNKKINCEGVYSKSSIYCRWSDCNCDSCSSWQREFEEQRLHFVVKEPIILSRENPTENVIFIHGFVSSSSFWESTVFPNLSKSSNSRHRIFAIDLLGFGKSPKPYDSTYTLEEHIEMIEKSIIKPFQLNSFHIVAHSMGCTVAISLAAKFSHLVKSITLVAPPYFSSTDVNASCTALNSLARRTIWPPLLFGSSVMTWYEHLGRTVCLIVCRNHLKWEWIIKLVTGKRELDDLITDITKHTHHSAWHIMHNVICGGAMLWDKYLEILMKDEVPVKIIHGDRDQVVPLECSYNMKKKNPHAIIHIISNADHSTVIVGRKEFARELEEFWLSSIK